MNLKLFCAKRTSYLVALGVLSCALATLSIIADGYRAGNSIAALVPLYANVDTMPEYLENTTDRVTSESFYWENRIIGALADARFHDNAAHIDRYQLKMGSLAHRMLRETDAAVADLPASEVPVALADANQRMADDLRRETDALLGRVLHTTSLAMKNAFSMSDN